MTVIRLPCSSIRDIPCQTRAEGNIKKRRRPAPRCVFWALSLSNFLFFCCAPRGKLYDSTDSRSWYVFIFFEMDCVLCRSILLVRMMVLRRRIEFNFRIALFAVTCDDFGIHYQNSTFLFLSTNSSSSIEQHGFGFYIAAFPTNAVSFRIPLCLLAY